ncbi:MAG TPA: hypothetical protein VHA52_01925, partial [Candidatus Babeliaceae bacterium]|nr:hypothetical protein [Candidatus Babeliaceae bacterium]
MTRNEYITVVNEARAEIFNTPFEDIKPELFGLYSLVSASILRYLSHYKNEEHYRLIQEIQFNKNLALIDQFHFDLLNELQISDPDNMLEKSVTSSQIFVTYHTGSYRMFIALLVQRKIPFCIVTDESFIDQQQELVNELHRRISQHLNQDYNQELEILKAQDPRLIFKLNERLKNGISVVFYIDGNTGVASDLKTNSNLLPIKFLDHFINARQGIALLAYLSKRPLVSAIAMRRPGLANSMDIKLEDDFLFTQTNRKEYVAVMTEKLYARLDDFL